MFSCRPTKSLKKNEYLLNRNKLIVSDKNIDTEEVNSLIKQKPNRRILWVVRFHLGVYHLADILKDRRGIKEKKAKKREEKKISKMKKKRKRREKRGEKTNEMSERAKIDKFRKRQKKKSGRSLKTWLQDVIGEAPVILDTLETNSSLTQFNFYLNNKGYFNSDVRKTIKYKKKKALVTYIIDATKPYYVQEKEYHIEDPTISWIIYNDTADSPIKEGEIYDSDNLDSERNRINKLMKNEGYYQFSKQYIQFKIDSSLKQYHRLKVNIIIKKRRYYDENHHDSILKASHKRFRINSVNVFPDYNALDIDGEKDYKRYYAGNGFYFNYGDKERIRPEVIKRFIFLDSGRYYMQKDVEQSHMALASLKNFRYVNIEFKEISPDSITGNYLLDCYVSLSRIPTQAFSIEAEGTYSAGDPGVAGSFIYQHKNSFKGAEIFNMKLKGAMEIQKIPGESSESNVISTVIPFNTLEAGAEAGLLIPRFLFPINPDRFPKYFKPQTNFNIGYNYQVRPDYRRHITNANFGYKWRETWSKWHVLYPVEINSVKIYPTDTFRAKIEAMNDPKLQNSYSDHLIAELKYSFIYNTQKINKRTNFTYFRGNLESAGNLINFANNVVGTSKDGDHYNLFNIQYAQFLRADIDLRYYKYLNMYNTLAFRVYAGMGYPYGNSKVLPFEKSFYAGGANGIRAWQVRRLGPGGYNDAAGIFIDRTGDIVIEMSTELRFPIYSVLEGAAFVDAGNVWLKDKNESFPYGEFQFDRFYKEIAVGAGLGARLNFSFFIVRIDGAVKILDPDRSQKNWALRRVGLRDINLNFGIGYPF